jgi:membrane protease YdiL (CAAX protease family)
MPSSEPPTFASKVSKTAIAFALIFPSLITWVYFQWLQGSDAGWQQAAFGIGKVIQFGFPIGYIWCFHRERIRRMFAGADLDSQRLAQQNLKSENLKISNLKISNLKSENLKSENENTQESTTTNPPTFWLAVVFGIAVGMTMGTVYFTILPDEIAQRLREQIALKISDLGIDSVWKYAMLSLFYAGCHSFLEEYYWRWFVFDSLRDHFSKIAANIVSSLGFMAHHVILLAFYFGWSSPMTWLCSAGVAIGGSAWAWMYARDGSLKSDWISHALVDAAIFGLGLYLLEI